MSLISDKRVEELLAKEAALEAEIARLRDENQQLMEQIAIRSPSGVERDMQLVMQINNGLRAALESIVKTAPWSDEDGHFECLNIARKALAKEGK